MVDRRSEWLRSRERWRTKPIGACVTDMKPSGRTRRLRLSRPVLSAYGPTCPTENPERGDGWSPDGVTFNSYAERLKFSVVVCGCQTFRAGVAGPRWVRR